MRSGLFPAVIAVVAGVGSSFIPPRLHPPSAVRLLTLTTVVAGLAVVWGLAMVAVGLLAELPWLTQYLGWCRRILGAHWVLKQQQQQHERIKKPVAHMCKIGEKDIRPWIIQAVDIQENRHFIIQQENKRTDKKKAYIGYKKETVFLY